MKLAPVTVLAEPLWGGFPNCGATKEIIFRRFMIPELTRGGVLMGGEAVDIHFSGDIFILKNRLYQPTRTQRCERSSFSP